MTVNAERAHHWNLMVLSALFLIANCGGDSSSPPSPTYTVGGVVSGVSGSGLVLRNNGRDDLSIALNGSFVFPTPVVSGTAYSVTVESQPVDPTLNCIAMRAGRDGVVQSADVTAVSVVCAEIARIAYVGYYDSASFQFLTAELGIDPDSGSLTLNQTQAGTGFPPIIAGDGRYVYVPGGPGGAGGLGIAGFAIDDASRSLTALAGSPFGVGVVAPYPPCSFPVSCPDPGPTVLLADPGRERLYAYFVQYLRIPVISKIVAFSIDPGTGALMELGVPAVQGGNPTVGMIIDPGGRFLYSANAFNSHIVDPGGVAHYTIDKATGALGSPGADGAFTWPLSFEPRGNFAYAADSTAGVGQVLAVDPASGALTHIGSDSVAPGLSSLIVDPAAAFAYGGCTGGLCAFGLDATGGVLTALPGNPFATSESPTTLVLDPSGKFAFAICAEGICVYSLDPATGIPSLTPTSPFTIPNSAPISIVVTN